jgi:SAM-dependent methyltransferase
MSFDVSADAYGRFMGRWSEPLAARLVDQVGVTAGQRALDVGCGPGALLGALVPRLGAEAVCAVEPSATFAAAAARRFPEVRVARAGAEALPFDDDSFDVALAGLVVHFMRDPVRGLGEMRRVVVDGGMVAATVWDEAGGRGPLSPFWRAAETLFEDLPGEKSRAGARAGQLAELFDTAGLHDIHDGELSVTRRFESFGEWWQPMELGVGPAGDFVQSLDASAARALEDACEQRLSPGPLELTATAWCVVGRA